MRPRESDLFRGAAVLEVHAGRAGEAAGLLRRILTEDPAMRPRVYDLLRQMFPAWTFLEGTLPADTQITGEDTQVLADQGDVDGAGAAWTRLLEVTSRPALRFIATYTGLHMDRRDVAAAFAAWSHLRDAGKPRGEMAGNLVLNGAFHPGQTSGRGFDRRMRTVRGLLADFARSDSDRGGRALRVSVSQGAPVGVPTMCQVIPLAGGPAGTAWLDRVGLVPLPSGLSRGDGPTRPRAPGGRVLQWSER